MVEILVVDAFTDRPFSGNPAAVTVLDRFPPDEWMQLVAREMNLSETAFVVPRPEGEHGENGQHEEYDLRWFTPATEVDLCGHATLAGAHVLGGTAVFHTRSGVLTCRPGLSGSIEMDFPADRPTDAPLPELFQGVDVQTFVAGRFDGLAELPDEAAVRNFRPDLAAIAALPYRGVIVTALADQSGVDFVSRYFAPGVGVPEDPVTGSSHCLLSPFWARRLGRLELVGYQASARGGTVRTRLEGERVVLGGDAVTVARVDLLVDPPE